MRPIRQHFVAVLERAVADDIDRCLQLVRGHSMVTIVTPRRAHVDDRNLTLWNLCRVSSPDPDPRPPSSQTPDKPRWLRLSWPVLAWILFLAWSNIPPYRMHINGVRWGDHSFAWHWKLYHQGGLGVCEVRYFDMHADGAPIKRWELLGYERPGDMPDNVARTSKKTLRPAYNQVCNALKKQGDPDPNVQAYARCGVWMGWKVVERRRRNVCIDPTKRPKKSKAKVKAKSNVPEVSK